jgi:hypothetical protein
MTNPTNGHPRHSLSKTPKQQFQGNCRRQIILVLLAACLLAGLVAHAGPVNGQQVSETEKRSAIRSLRPDPLKRGEAPFNESTRLSGRETTNRTSNHYSLIRQIVLSPFRLGRSIASAIFHREVKSSPPVAGDPLLLQGQVVGIDVEREGENHIYNLTLRLEFTNSGKQSRIVLLGTYGEENQWWVQNVWLSRSREEALTGKSFSSRSLFPANSRDLKKWMRLRKELQSSAPPPSLTAIIKPNQTYTQYLKTFIVLRDNDNPSSMSTIWLQLALELWPSSLEPSHRDENAFSNELRKRWRRSGELWQEPILSAPIRFDVGTRRITRGSVLDPFIGVPASVRSRLVDRLKLLIEYDRTQQWDKMYELLSERFTQGETKEHLINRRRYVAEKLGGDELVDFTPQAMTALTPDSGWWFIRGCGEFKSAGRTKRVESVVEAYLQKGDWYFSQIRMNTPIDGDPKPCQH